MTAGEERSAAKRSALALARPCVGARDVPRADDGSSGGDLAVVSKESRAAYPTDAGRDEVRDTIDALALNLSNYGHTWTPELRSSYERAIALLERAQNWPFPPSEPKATIKTEPGSTTVTVDFRGTHPFGSDRPLHSSKEEKLEASLRVIAEAKDENIVRDGVVYGPSGYAAHALRLIEEESK